jgi:hypothetical protein
MRRRQPGPYSLCAVVQSPDGLVDIHTVAETVPECGPFGDGRGDGRLEEVHGVGGSAQGRASVWGLQEHTFPTGGQIWRYTLFGLVGLHVNARVPPDLRQPRALETALTHRHTNRC